MSHHIKVRWSEARSTFLTTQKMWTGSCTCGKRWQFWFFGATLGYGLEHIRRESARGTLRGIVLR